MNFSTIVWPTKLWESNVFSRVRITVCSLEYSNVTTTHDVCWSFTGNMGPPLRPRSHSLTIQGPLAQVFPCSIIQGHFLGPISILDRLELVHLDLTIQIPITLSPGPAEKWEVVHRLKGFFAFSWSQIWFPAAS